MYGLECVTGKGGGEPSVPPRSEGETVTIRNIFPKYRDNPHPQTLQLREHSSPSSASPPEVLQVKVSNAVWPESFLLFLLRQRLSSPLIRLIT